MPLTWVGLGTLANPQICPCAWQCWRWEAEEAQKVTNVSEYPGHNCDWESAPVKRLLQWSRRGEHGPRRPVDRVRELGTWADTPSCMPSSSTGLNRAVKPVSRMGVKCSILLIKNVMSALQLFCKQPSQLEEAPSISSFAELIPWMSVEFYQVLFLHTWADYMIFDSVL